MIQDPKQTLKLTATTFHGLEPLLVKELTELGADNIETHTRAVSFEGDAYMMCRANLWLRTAIRVLIPIHTFQARNENELYDGVREVLWRDHLSLRKTFAVSAAVHSPYFNHSHYVALKTKDAIVDQFREDMGKRPSVDIKYPTYRIHIHVHEDQCTLSLDSSGDPLFKRGYRKETNEAPLNEILAAGMLMLSGWKGESNFIDPMCGSGTLAIEAATIATNMAPNFYRRRFGFEDWMGFDIRIWREVRKEVRQGLRSFKHKIIGSDISGRAIEIAQRNAERARVIDMVKFEVNDFADQFPPEGGGLMITNPPYGERIAVEDIGGMYKQLGDRLKQAYNGYDAWVFSSNKGALKQLGLRTSVRHTLYNGPLECKFHCYSMYQGSKKGV